MPGQMKTALKHFPVVSLLCSGFFVSQKTGVLIILMLSAGAFAEERVPAVLFGVSLLCKVKFETSYVSELSRCYHSNEISLIISVFTGHH